MNTSVPTKEEFLLKIELLKKKSGADLSTEEDLSLAIMNLVSLEEHFFFTAEKTKKSHYFDLLQETREIRKSLLARMMDKNEGETWCIAKHLLAATMRLIEVGTKHQGDGRREDARQMFDQAYQLYAMFWAIRLKLIDLSGVQQIADDKLNAHDSGGGSQPWTQEDILTKLVNCCDE